MGGADQGERRQRRLTGTRVLRQIRGWLGSANITWKTAHFWAVASAVLFAMKSWRPSRTPNTVIARCAARRTAQHFPPTQSSPLTCSPLRPARICCRNINRHPTGGSASAPNAGHSCSSGASTNQSLRSLLSAPLTLTRAPGPSSCLRWVEGRLVRDCGHTAAVHNLSRPLTGSGRLHWQHHARRYRARILGRPVPWHIPRRR